MKKFELLTFAVVSLLNVNLFAVQFYTKTQEGCSGLHPQEDIVVVDGTRQSGLYAAIFDGHGGYSVAHELERNLIEKIDSRTPNIEMNPIQLRDLFAEAFLSLNEEILTRQIFGKLPKDPGSTALVAAILGDQKLVISNVGDCRAVLVKTGGFIQITSDHKASDPQEITRVQSMSGFVIRGRVNGTLAVSRAFGDANSCAMRDSDGVIVSCVRPEPDVFVRSVEGDDEYLIMASDGLWDKVTSEGAVGIVENVIHKCLHGQNPELFRKKRPICMEIACKELIQRAVAEGSKDDISVIIVDFKSR